MPDGMFIEKTSVRLPRTRQLLYRDAVWGRQRKHADRVAKFASGRSAAEQWFSASSSDSIRLLAAGPSVTLSSSVRVGVEWPLPNQGRVEQECARLRETNERLSEEVRQLRALLARLNQQNSAAASADPRASRESRTLAAEMLVQLDPAESEAVLRILGSEPQPVLGIVRTLGPSSSLRIGSLLANCHAAIVDGDLIVPTEFGRALFNWIMKQTE
jgi:hypothetical protein